MGYKTLVIMGGITAALVAIRGKVVFVAVLFIFLIIAMAIDFFSGFLKAKKNKNWKSSIARDGWIKKIGTALLAMLAMFLDTVVTIVSHEYPEVGLSALPMFALSTLAIVVLIITEAGSTIENVKEMGVHAPAILTSTIGRIRDISNKHNK